MKSPSFRLAPVLILIAILSGCGIGGDGVTSIKPSPDSEYSADPDAQIGSRNNPIALGKNALINEWKVQITSVDPNALQKVLKSDPYTSKPSASERFLLIKVKATYVGEGSSEPTSDLRFKIVGSKGNTFTKSCGYFGDSFDQNGETFSYASVSGDFCFTVDADQLVGATVSVQGDYGSDERYFFSLQP
jgi:hypothetical protein